MILKLGDRVMYTAAFDRGFHKVGTVVDIESYFNCYRQIGVDFGKGFEGHNCSGKIKTNTGWYCSIFSLKLKTRQLEFDF